MQKIIFIAPLCTKFEFLKIQCHRVCHQKFNYFPVNRDVGYPCVFDGFFRVNCHARLHKAKSHAINHHVFIPFMLFNEMRQQKKSVFAKNARHIYVPAQPALFFLRGCWRNLKVRIVRLEQLMPVKQTARAADDQGLAKKIL